MIYVPDENSVLFRSDPIIVILSSPALSLNITCSQETTTLSCLVATTLFLGHEIIRGDSLSAN